MANKDTLLKQIDIDKDHIEKFVLETEEGTKRTKEKFHRNACEQRNLYVSNEIAVFKNFLSTIKFEMQNRLLRDTPEDKSEFYLSELSRVENLFDLVKLNSNISNAFKLGIDFIMSSIDEDTSLEELNDLIRKYIDKFHEAGISLTIEDFKYTMFTEKYMQSFFQNSDFSLMKDVFEKIYFACPDIKLQLKMNLEHIVRVYDRQLLQYVISMRDSLFANNGVTSATVVDRYISVRSEVGNLMAMDEYTNLNLFLDGKKKIADYVENAAARTKNYDMFVVNGNYASLSDVDKQSYDSAIMGFYLTLNELKKYYGYEFIVKDLLERYKNKDTVKGQYLAKKKEIEKEEKTRMGIYKSYLKANGIGFLAKKSEINMKNSMLKMNEQITKLHTLYDELKDLEITYQISNLSQSASIYDLFLASLTSFAFLEKCFQTNENFMENSLEENIKEYFRFIYNPNNSILRKVNVFTEYDLVEIVAEKYRLLDLNVTSDIISPETIDATMESVKFINLIQNINRSHISINTIQELCKFKELTASFVDEL